MRRSLQGKHVLITGASGGIGGALARQFAQRRSARLVLVDRDAAALAAIARELCEGDRGVDVEQHVVDITQPEQVAELALRLSGAPIDVLVNCAGIAMVGPFSTMPFADVEAVLSVDLVATMRFTHALLPLVRRGSWACVVNMASAAGLAAPGGLAAYAAAKFGVVGFSQALRIELRREGIDVVCVCPAFVRTALLRNSGRRSSAPDQAIERMHALMQRAGRSTDSVARRTCRAIERNEGLVVMELWVRAVLGMMLYTPFAAERVGGVVYQGLSRMGAFGR
ncbi:MAG: SDR family NAD(P)-dependent oxidoreductase [Deltaproteobacteria bacterium]|nr:SDR family NAD(P)-dependent oxidoreductase [Deltaproteobacteria bacterium]